MPPKPAEWEKHKDEIIRLWKQHVPLKDIAARMKQAGLLDASVPSYSRRLKAWGYDRNVSAGQSAKAYQVLKDREREGKLETEVIQGGQRISAAKIRRLGRQAKKYEKQRNKGVLVTMGSVPSPPRLIIRTPPMKSPLLQAALNFQFPAEIDSPKLMLDAIGGALVPFSRPTRTEGDPLPSPLFGQTLPFSGSRGTTQPTSWLDMLVARNFAILEVMFAGGLSSQAGQLMRTSSAPTLLEVLQEITRRIANDAMEPREFYPLARLVGITNLCDLVHETLRWPDTSPAVIAFRRSFIDLTLIYAMETNDSQAITTILATGWSVQDNALNGAITADIDKETFRVLLGHHPNLYRWYIDEDIARNPILLTELLTFMASDPKKLKFDFQTMAPMLRILALAYDKDEETDGPPMLPLDEAVHILLRRYRIFHECRLNRRENVLQTAVRAGNYDLVELLLARKYDADPPVEPIDKFDPMNLFEVIAGLDSHGIALKIFRVLVNWTRNEDCNCSAAPTTKKRYFVFPNEQLISANITRPYPVTPLLEAVYQDNPRISELLIAGGARIHRQDPIFGTLSALQFAALRGNLELVKLFIDAGADVNEIFQEGIGMESATPCVPQTPLEAALWSGEHDVIDELLANGAEVFCGSRSALDFAIDYGLWDAAVYLTSRIPGGVLDERLHKWTWLPVFADDRLAEAVNKGDLDEVNALLGNNQSIQLFHNLPYGCELEIKSGEGGQLQYRVKLPKLCNGTECTCEEWGEWCTRSIMPDPNISTIIHQGTDDFYDVNKEYSEVWVANPLPYVCETADLQLQVQLAQVLLESGCDPNAVAPYQQGDVFRLEPALSSAFRCKTINSKLIQLLVKYGADPLAVPYFIGQISPSDVLAEQDKASFKKACDALACAGYRFPEVLGDQERRLLSTAIGEVFEPKVVSSVVQLGLDIGQLGVWTTATHLLRVYHNQPKGLGSAHPLEFFHYMTENNMQLIKASFHNCIYGSETVLDAYLVPQYVDGVDIQGFEALLQLWDSRYGVTDEKTHRVGIRRAVFQAVDNGLLDILNLIMEGRDACFTIGFLKSLRKYVEKEDEYPGILRYLEDYCERFMEVENEGSDDEDIEMVMYDVSTDPFD